MDIFDNNYSVSIGYLDESEKKYSSTISMSDDGTIFTLNIITEEDTFKVNMSRQFLISLGEVLNKRLDDDLLHKLI